MKTKNPYVNATLAAGYIVVLVTVMNFVMSLSKEGDGEDFMIIPVTMLSLFVLSAAVMGFLFVVEPLKMYLDDKRQEAVTFFLKTVGTFAIYAVAFILTLIYTLK